MDRKAIISLVVIILFIIAGALYYLYYYPSAGMSGTSGALKSFEDKKEEARQLILSGQIKTFGGEIAEVGNDYLVILVKTPGLEETGKEVKISVTKNTLIRKITTPEIPEGSTELIPAGEMEINIADLKAGDSIFVDVKEGGEASIIDLME